MRFSTRGLGAATIVAVVLVWPRSLNGQADNPELKELYEADQMDRQVQPGRASIDWAVVTERDAARRRRVRELIDRGRVTTGADYEHAAMVFQHGDSADDILLAHILAVSAIGKGNPGARWLAAASLDRFLMRVAQPQVFGTQYNMKDGQPWTQDPYNRSLVGGRLRADNCVPDQEYQARALEAMNRKEDPPPAPRPCENRP